MKALEMSAFIFYPTYLSNNQYSIDLSTCFMNCFELNAIV